MTFKKLNIQINALIEGVIRRETMSEVGELVRDLVKSRTKKGFGVAEPEGKATRLKGLSESYKKRRRTLKKQGKLDQSTSPTKSNLTQTSQMLDSVKSKASTAKAEVFLDNEKAQRKAELQANDNREFMNLSKSEVNKIKKLLEQKIIDDIKKRGL